MIRSTSMCHHHHHQYRYNHQHHRHHHQYRYNHQHHRHHHRTTMLAGNKCALKHTKKSFQKTLM